MRSEKRESLRRISQLREAWEGVGENGPRPDLGQFLLHGSKLEREHLVDICSADLEIRLGRGETPSFAKDYVAAANIPGLADDELFRLIDHEYQWCWRHSVGSVTKATYQELFPRLASRIASQVSPRWNCPYCKRQVSETDEAKDPLLCSGPGCGSKVPRWALVRRRPQANEVPTVPGFTDPVELGRGGMGVVYWAWQETPSRPVALKMFLPHTLPSKADLARFKTEANSMVNVRHGNIVQVHSVGEHEGRPFLCLEFCSGGSLDKKVAGSPMPPEDAATLAETLARAIHVAHKAGIVHRDLKPANILFTDDGQPKITDFGLAKNLDEATRTVTGAVMGTPSYMAPEQAQGRKDVDPLADVYALGATLYHCLTGRPPFSGESVLDVLDQVRGRAPLPPSHLQETIPPELETICLKCLEKIPKDRYASAEALADDLRRFLNDEPIVARPADRGERVRKWIRRNPLPTAFIGTLAALALVLFVAVLILGWAVVMTLERKKEAEGRIQATEEKNRLMGEKSQAVEEKNRETEAKNRELEAKLLMRALQPLFDQGPPWQTGHVEKISDNVTALRKFDSKLAEEQFHHLYGPKGRLVAVCNEELGHPHRSQDDFARLDKLRAILKQYQPEAALKLAERIARRRRTGEDVIVWPGPSDPATVVPAAVRFEEGKLKLGPLPPPREGVAGPRPDTAHHVLTRTPCGRDAGIEVSFEGAMDSGREVGVSLNAIPGHTQPITWVTFGPNGGEWVVSASGRSDQRGEVIRWDLATGKLRFTIPWAKSGHLRVAVSPRGELLAVANDQESVVRLFKAEDGTEVGQLPCDPHNLTTLAFSPAGDALAAGGNDRGGVGLVRVWDVGSRQVRRLLPIGPAGVHCLAFAPDGKSLAAGGRDNVVRRWDVLTGRQLAPLTGDQGPVLALDFSADGSLLATGGKGGWRLWDLKAERVTHGWKAATTSTLAFSSDGATLAVPVGTTVSLRSPGDGRELHSIRRYGEDFSAVAFSPDGKTLATGGFDRAVRLWDLASRRQVAVFEEQAYSFLLGVPRPPGTGPEGWTAPRAASLGSVREGKGDLELTVLRNREVLHRKKVNASDVGGGPLRLEAIRKGDELTFQVNRLPALVFRDPFPLRGDRNGVFGIWWPRGEARLRNLRASLTHLPAAPSPLEEGDALYLGGDYEAAREVYRKQAIPRGAPETGLEARYKQALCLVGMGRLKEGEALCRELAADPSTLWGRLAVGQLWLLCLRQSRFADAEHVLDSMRWGARVEELAAALPDGMCNEILDAYRRGAWDIEAFRHNPDRIKNLKRTRDIEDFLGVTNWNRLQTNRSLIRAYHLSGEKGDLEEACRIAEGVLRQKAYWRDIDPTYMLLVIEEHCYLLREQGKYQLALEELNRWLGPRPRNPAVAQDVSPGWVFDLLLLERARAHVALGNRVEAKRDVELLLRRVPRDYMQAKYWAAAHLMLAVIADQDGDPAGAAKAWKEGFRQSDREDFNSTRFDQGFVAVVQRLILGSLSGEMTDEEAGYVRTQILGRFTNGPVLLSVVELIDQPSTAVLRSMWQSPNGRKAASQLAFQQVPLRDYLRIVVAVTGAEVLLQDALGSKSSDEQSLLVWQLAEGLTSSYFRGQLQNGQIRDLALAWKDVFLVSGTRAVASLNGDTLLRGRLAYMFGCRYVRLRKSGDAAKMFEAAKRDANCGPDRDPKKPSDLALHRLATDELEQLRRK